MTGFLLLILFGYGAILAYLYIFQRKLMYLPDRQIGPPEQYGLTGFTDRDIASGGGTSLHLWHHPAAAGFPTIVYYHGNASHLGNRAGIYAALAARGFGVIAISYRGYGRSGGSPSEQGLYADARAALAFATQQERIPLSKIILYGESLGTGVAVQMATEYKVGALVLQAAYKSVARRAAELYSYVPVSLLIHDRYDSIDKIGRITSPLLLFHGHRDATIPLAHGQAMFDAAPQPKRSFFFPEGGHNDFDSAVISSHVLAFAEEHHLITH